MSPCEGIAENRSQHFLHLPTFSVVVVREMNDEILERRWNLGSHASALIDPQHRRRAAQYRRAATGRAGSQNVVSREVSRTTSRILQKASSALGTVGRQTDRAFLGDGPQQGLVPCDQELLVHNFSWGKCTKVQNKEQVCTT